MISNRLKRLAVLFLAVIFMGGALLQSAPKAFAFAGPNEGMSDCDHGVPMPCKDKVSGCINNLGCIVFPAALPAAGLDHVKLAWRPIQYHISALDRHGLSLKPDHSPPISQL